MNYLKLILAFLAGLLVAQHLNDYGYADLQHYGTVDSYPDGTATPKAWSISLPPPALELLSPSYGASPPPQPIRMFQLWIEKRGAS